MVRLLDRVRERPVSHPPPVREQADVGAIGPVQRRRPNQSTDLDGRLFRLLGRNLKHCPGDLTTVYRRHSVPQLAAPRTRERPPTVWTQLKPDFRVRHRVVGDDPVNPGLLCVGRAQKPATRWQVTKELPDGDRRALRRAGRSDRNDLAVVDLYAGAAVGVRSPRSQLDASDRCDARQRLSAEAKGGHCVQVFGDLQFAGREPLEGQLNLVGRNARAIVSNANVLDAAAADLDPYPGRARVQGVLDQLLDGRGRALDYLPSRDLRRNFRSEELDGHGLSSVVGSERPCIPPCRTRLWSRSH